MRKIVFLCLLVVLMILIMLISVPQNAEAAAQIYPDAAAGLINARIYEAVALPDGNIGAVFNMGGNIMYGILNISENKWTVVSLGTTASSDVNAASLGLDVSGRAHIVFVNTANDLVYRFFNGSVWTAGQIIDSRNIGGSGALSSPDIAIDAAGKAHIAYMDSRGGHVGGEFHYIRNDLMYASNSTGSWVITVRQFGDGSHASATHNDWREAVAPPKISLTGNDSPIGAVFYDRWRVGGVETITFNFRYRIYPSIDPINPFLETPLIISNTDQRARFSLYDMESVGISTFSLFRSVNYLYLKNGVNEIDGTRLNFVTSAADMFVNRADQNKLYYAAISGSALHLYQDGVFKGPLTLPIALSGTHIKAATVVVGTYQYVIYTDLDGRLQTVSFKTMPDAGAPLNSVGFPRVTGATLTGFTLEAQVDESARVFFIVADAGSAAPTSAQVVAGANYGGVTIRASGNFPVMPNSINSRSVTGLTAATNYEVYIVARDGEGNLQDLPTLINAATVTPIAVINKSAIPGITAPVTGMTQVTTIVETDQYTANIVWSPQHATFDPDTAYTAIITLTPKWGFTLIGVNENFFTVEAAISAANAADSGVVTAVFPTTAVLVTGVTLTRETATIEVGSGIQLIATVAPANATNKNVTWSSDNETVATVSATGMVTGISAGTAVITVTTADADKTATSAITVTVPYLPSNNAVLSDLTLSSGSLVPAFAQSTTDYTVNVGNDVTGIDVKATASDPTALMTINNEDYGSGSIRRFYNLVVGANLIKIEIIAEDGITKKTYTVIVNRSAAPLATPQPAVTEPSPATDPVSTPPLIHTSIISTVVEKFIAADKPTTVKLEGVAEIIIAAGSVTGEAPKITVQVVPITKVASLTTAAAESGLIAVSGVVEVIIIGGQFAAPVQLTLNYNKDKVATGRIPSLFVYNERTKRWIYLGGQVGDGTITVIVDKFSKFSVFATKPLPSMTDISNHWGRDSIRTLAGMGVVNVCPDGKFNSDAIITRAEFISMLTRSLFLRAKPQAAAKFKDVDGWAKGAIGAAAEAGLIIGYADGTFGSSLKITRAEMAAILQRVINKEFVPVNFNIEIEFTDEKDFPNWAVQSINTVSRSGLMRGFPDRTFRSGSTATRAEAVVMLYRLVAKR